MRSGSSRVFRVALPILVGTVVAALSLWATLGDRARELKALEKNALCVLNLPAGVPKSSTSFTTSRTIDHFEVGMQFKGKDERLSLSIAGSNGLVSRVTIVTIGDKITRFGCGRDIPPGTYEVELRQETGNHGARVVVCGEMPVFITGWQIWSRAFVGVLVLSGICAFGARKSSNAKLRTATAVAFQHLLLGFVIIFLYLLLHEGGHSLVEVIFGRYDFAVSDFWGIHGAPHSGGQAGSSLEPWKQAIISGAGPHLPTLAGWVLFLFWNSRLGRNLRSARPIMNLYIPAIVALLVFPEIVATPGCLLGFITNDGDWNSFIANVPGPMWLIKGLLWVTVLVSAIILWRVIPEVMRAWKAQFPQARKSPHPSANLPDRNVA